jgi:hypothetical protein
MLGIGTHGHSDTARPLQKLAGVNFQIFALAARFGEPKDPAS